jgi:hypothetical protein
MKLNAPTAGKSIIALQRIALGFPGTEEGTSCGKRAFKARKKAFLFVGSEESSYNIMLKLHESLPEATRLQAKSPQNYAVGGHGWVKATFKNPEALPSPLFDRWIKESYRLLVPAATFDPRIRRQF